MTFQARATVGFYGTPPAADTLEEAQQHAEKGLLSRLDADVQVSTDWRQLTEKKWQLWVIQQDGTEVPTPWSVTEQSA